MEFTQETIEKLTNLRARKKFTDSDWEKRGLNPSDSEKVNEMIRLTDMCLDELLAMIKSNPTEKQVREVLINGLDRFKTSYYDTEEKEFISDEFHKIGSIVGLDISENLDEWLYGKALSTSIRFNKKKEVIVETKSVECSKCKSILNVQITETKPNAHNYWIIGQCNQCGEYNLLSTGENASKMKFENFALIKTLKTVENSEEQARNKLEEIKYSRGSK
jgi:hypothetical protein